MNEILIRQAEPGDLPDLTGIYNHYIAVSHCTFDLEPFTVEARREWFGHFHGEGRHRLFVAARGSTVIGYAGSHRFRPKPAYDPSVETSVYVAPGEGGRGLGARLYEALFAALAREDVHRAYAGIALPNAASLALHARFGYVEAGRFHEIGRKFGRWWDVAWLEKRF